MVQHFITNIFSKIVLVAVRDEASAKMTSDGYNALSKLAAQSITSINHRGSFALIGFTDEEKPRFVKQVSLLFVILFNLV